jgi:hypothetical protein
MWQEVGESAEIPPSLRKSPMAWQETTLSKGRKSAAEKAECERGGRYAFAEHQPAAESSFYTCDGAVLPEDG